MTITVYSGFSKRRNSTAQPSGGALKTVNLKHPTSLMHPVFLMTSYSLSDNYLKWGNRFYYIDDIVIVNASMAEYHCSVDALASWKSQIGGLTEYIARAASGRNPYVLDNLYPTYNYVTTVKTELSGLLDAFTGSTYVVGIMSGGSTSNAVQYYALTASQFAALTTYMFDGTWLDLTESDISVSTQKELVNPAQYIVSCRWYPFTITGNNTYIKFGWWTSNVVGGLLSGRTYLVSTTVSLPENPGALADTNRKYLNAAPFTKRTLFCYNFGQIELDSQVFALSSDNDITIDIDVDYWAGAGMLYIRHNGRPIQQIGAEIGCDVPLSYIKSSMLGAGLATMPGGSLINEGLSILGQITGISSGISQSSPTPSIIGQQGSKVAYMQTPCILSKFSAQVGYDVTQHGYAYCATGQIGSFSGYIQTEKADVNLPCTPEERDIITSYMDGGFFYE